MRHVVQAQQPVLAPRDDSSAIGGEDHLPWRRRRYCIVGGLITRANEEKKNVNTKEGYITRRGRRYWLVGKEERRIPCCKTTLAARFISGYTKFSERSDTRAPNHHNEPSSSSNTINDIKTKLACVRLSCLPYCSTSKQPQHTPKLKIHNTFVPAGQRPDAAGARTACSWTARRTPSPFRSHTRPPGAALPRPPQHPPRV